MIDRVREFLAQSRLAGVLRQVQFPISKQELIDFAEEHNAPDKVIELLYELPDTVFYKASQLLEHLRGQAEPEQPAQPEGRTYSEYDFEEFEEGD